MFELRETECLVEMQILIKEFADIKSEAHESYEVRRAIGSTSVCVCGASHQSDCRTPFNTWVIHLCARFHARCVGRLVSSASYPRREVRTRMTEVVSAIAAAAAISWLRLRTSSYSWHGAM